MKRYINRELSWLDFNARVLQEAADQRVPLLERLRFIGIFSNNLDEFFQVRYATVKRIAQSDKTGKKIFGGSIASDLLIEITQKVIEQQQQSNLILNEIEKALVLEKIYFIDEKQVFPEHESFLKEYFINHVSPSLMTIILRENEAQDFRDHSAFLVIKLVFEQAESQYALIEIPKELDRFVVLPKVDGKQYIMFLDDVIRFHFQLIFNFFDYSSISSFMIKVTRDAELDMEGDVSKSYVNKIIESVKDRILAEPVRLVYDSGIERDMLQLLKDKLEIDSTDSLIPGGRYHHRRDFMKFPNLHRQDLQYEQIEPLAIPGLSLEKSIFGAIDTKDFLLYTPFHSFSYFIKFLREAALDPEVTSIKITIYRLSKISNVVSSLINAAKNGKKVLVQIELQARFDEANNINHAGQLEAAGVKLIFGIQGLKVHSKIGVIEKQVNDKIRRFGFISTGNFNEDTAKVYTDYTLFTSNRKLLKEVNKVFNFLEVPYKLKKYKHLIVSPHYSANTIERLIDNEIKNRLEAKTCGIQLKMNAITNFRLIDKLYEASAAGVPIKMIVRGICCLIPGVKGLSENIEVVSVVDKFLEHPRVYIFENGGEPKYYISSADFMTRNIENRVEVAAPIYDLDLQNQIQAVFSLCWDDNIKGRHVNGRKGNKFIENKKSKIRSQWAVYKYYEKQIE